MKPKPALAAPGAAPGRRGFLTEGRQRWPPAGHGPEGSHIAGSGQGPRPRGARPARRLGVGLRLQRTRWEPVPWVQRQAPQDLLQEWGKPSGHPQPPGVVDGPFDQ